MKQALLPVWLRLGACYDSFMETFKRFMLRRSVWLTIAGLLIAAFIWLGNECNLTKADWGTWVGSVGTVGTLIGTVWIATSERRKREAEAHSLASITASAILFKLMEIRKALHACCDALASPLENPWSTMRICASVIGEAQMWTTHELALLALLPNHLATTLSICGADIDWCRRTLVQTSNMPLDHDPLEFDKTRITLANRLKLIMRTLDQKQEDVVHFLAKAGFSGWTGG